MGGQVGLNARAWAIGIGLLVLVAAGAGFGGYELGLRANRTAAPTSSASPLPSPSTPTSAGVQSPSPAPEYPTLGGAPVVATNLQCKLPVYLPGRNGSGAFINFPAGTVTSDSSSMVGAPGSSTGSSDPGDWFGLTYDRAVNRWLPVPYAWVAPDGGVYSYATDWNRHAGANPLNEVNAQTGNSAILQPLAPIQGAWQVIAFTSNYIYAINPHWPGLYSIPLSGPWNNENYTHDGFWTAASGSYAFGSATIDGGAVVRIDVRDQTRIPWFDKSSSAQIIGFDGASNPVIWTGSDLWIASAPDQATRIGSQAPLALTGVQQGLYGVQAPVFDSHGLWLSLAEGIYLYAGGKLTKVSNVVAQVAGICS